MAQIDENKLNEGLRGLMGHETGGSFDPNQLGDYRLPNGKKVVAGTAGAQPVALGLGQWTNFARNAQGKLVVKGLKDGEIPSTWKEHAKQVLGNANAPMSMENQKAVLKGLAKHRMSPQGGGLSLDEFFASWNGGMGNAKTYKNSKQISDYVAKVYQSANKYSKGYPTDTQVEQPVEQSKPGFLRGLAGALIKGPEQAGRSILAAGGAAVETGLGNIVDGLGFDNEPGNNTLGQNYQKTRAKLGQSGSLASNLNNNIEDATVPDLTTKKGLADTGAGLAETASLVAPVPKLGMAARLGKVGQASAQGALMGTGQAVADTARDYGNEELTTRNTAKNIGVNIGGGALLGGALGLSSKGIQRGTEDVLQSRVIPQQFKQQAGDMAQANKSVRIASGRLGPDGNVVKGSTDVYKTTQIAKIRKDIDKLVGINAKGANPKAVRDKLYGMSDETIESISNIAEKHKPRLDGNRFIADKAIDATEQQAKSSNEATQLLTKEIKNTGISIPAVDLKDDIVYRIQSDSFIKEIDKRKALKSLEQQLPEYVNNKKAGTIDFERLDKMRRDGNTASLTSDAVDDVVSRHMAESVRDVITENSQVYKQQYPQLAEAIDKYVAELANYGTIQDTKFYFELLNKTQVPKLSALANLVGSTVATGGTYNPFLFIGGSATSQFLGDAAIKSNTKYGQSGLKGMMTDVAKTKTSKTIKTVENLARKKIKVDGMSARMKTAAQNRNELPTIKF